VEEEMTAAESTFVPTARRLASAAGWVVIALGLLVLVGWAADSTLLVQISPDLPSMKALTAVSLIALGGALVLLAPAEDPGPRHRAGVACGASGALIGAVGIADSAYTAVILILCGLALVTIDRGSPRYRVALVLELVAGFAVLAALIGLAYGVDTVHGRSGSSGVPLHGAVALALVVLATALARPQRGIVDFFRGDDPASRLIRRLTPIAILLPPLLGGTRLAGENAGLFSDDVGVALVALGGIVIIIGMVTVSARYLRVQEAHRALGERSFRAVTDAAVEAIISADQSGRIIYFNPAAERMFGYPSEQAMGARLTTLMPERFRERHRAGLARFLETGEPRVIGGTVELVGQRSDGEQFPISLSLVDWAAEGEVCFTATISDISKRLEVERALAAERRQLADAQQLASVGSWEVNLDTGERTWSEQQFRNLGFTPGPIPTREQIREFTHPDDRAIFDEFSAKLDREEAELQIEYRIVLADGEVRAIQAQGEIVTDPDGTRRLMGTSRDVTAERDAERLKDDFFGLISHELRTPLTSIIGYTELLTEIEAENLSEQGRRFIEVIERNSRRELSLVGDLLLLTKITAGSFEIDVGRADLAEIVRATAEQARPDAGKAGVEIALELDQAPVVEGDPHRLGQVVENLVSNAIKFTPRGGRIAVRAGREEDHAVLAVTDTGIGIPPEECDRLFERMFRAAEAERRHIQGTGLGLTIVKAIVDAHDGSIAVESELGRGTTFLVTLPLLRAAVPGPQPAGKDGQQNGGGRSEGERMAVENE
jgi:PAS domain S-box-containing protein